MTALPTSLSTASKSLSSRSISCVRVALDVPLAKLFDYAQPEDRQARIGDRVVVPFTIACGRCFFCQRELWSCCDNSNPNYWIAEQMMGYSPSGLFGYSHMMGGYAGGQAQFARVPSPMWAPSRFQKAYRMKRCCSFQISFPPAT